MWHSNGWGGLRFPLSLGAKVNITILSLIVYHPYAQSCFISLCWPCLEPSSDVWDAAVCSGWAEPEGISGFWTKQSLTAIEWAKNCVFIRRIRDARQLWSSQLLWYFINLLWHKLSWNSCMRRGWIIRSRTDIDLRIQNKDFMAICYNFMVTFWKGSLLFMPGDFELARSLQKRPYIRDPIM